MLLGLRVRISSKPWLGRDIELLTSGAQKHLLDPNRGMTRTSCGKNWLPLLLIVVHEATRYHEFEHVVRRSIKIVKRVQPAPFTLRFCLGYHGVPPRYVLFLSTLPD